MEWDHFAIIKKQFIDDIVNDLKDLQLPPEWSPKDVIGYIVRKIEDKGNKI